MPSQYAEVTIHRCNSNDLRRVVEKKRSAHPQQVRARMRNIMQGDNIERQVSFVRLRRASIAISVCIAQFACITFAARHRTHHPYRNVDEANGDHAPHAPIGGTR